MSIFEVYAPVTHLGLFAFYFLKLHPMLRSATKPPSLFSASDNMFTWRSMSSIPGSNP